MKKIGMICQFPENTACGIVTAGRSKALQKTGYSVLTVFHPKPWFRPFQILHNAFRLRSCKVVIIQKLLPAAWLYMVALRLMAFRGVIIGIADDWEGVGGYASIRSRDSLIKMIGVTFFEEIIARRCDVLWCVSNLLLERFRHIGNAVYLPNGCNGIPVARQPHTRLTVAHIGRLDDPALADFLIRLDGLNDGLFDLLYAGGGENYQIVSNGCRKARVLPQQSPEEIRRVLGMVDIGIVYLSRSGMYSLIDQARSSVKLFEYMDAGVIPLCSSIGEPAEILKDFPELLLANDPQAWNDRIIGLTGKVETLRAGIRVLAGRYNHDKILKTVL